MAKQSNFMNLPQIPPKQKRMMIKEMSNPDPQLMSNEQIKARKSMLNKMGLIEELKSGVSNDPKQDIKS